MHNKLIIKTKIVSVPFDVPSTPFFGLHTDGGSLITKMETYYFGEVVQYYQARARSAQARRACALRALGLLLADGVLTVGWGKTF